MKRLKKAQILSFYKLIVETDLTKPAHPPPNQPKKKDMPSSKNPKQR